MRVPSSLAVVLACCALAAGCGGNGEGEDRLTKQEYIAAADAICLEANQQIDELGEPQYPEELAEYAEQVVELGEEQLGRLRALRPPQEDEATLNEAYDLLDQQLVIAGDLVEAARAGDLAEVQRLLAEGQRLNEQADEIAVAYGLEECGTD